MRCGMVFSCYFVPFRTPTYIAVWVTVWVMRKTPKYCVTIWDHKQKKFLISCEIRNFLVETAGLEPVTSCV